MSATGFAYKFMGRLEIDHDIPVGRSSGGTSYYYGSVAVDDWLLRFFHKAVRFRATQGRWRFRKLDRAVVLPAALAVMFPHETLGLMPVEAPL